MTGMRQEVARPSRMPTPMAAAPIMPAIEAYSGSTLLDGGEKMRKCDWASLGFFRLGVDWAVLHTALILTN